MFMQIVCVMGFYAFWFGKKTKCIQLHPIILEKVIFLNCKHNITWLWILFQVIVSIKIKSLQKGRFGFEIWTLHTQVQEFNINKRDIDRNYWRTKLDGKCITKRVQNISYLNQTNFFPWTFLTININY